MVARDGRTAFEVGIDIVGSIVSILAVIDIQSGGMVTTWIRNKVASFRVTATEKVDVVYGVAAEAERILREATIGEEE